MMALCGMVETMKGTYLHINTPDLYSKKYNEMIKTLVATSDTDEEDLKQHLSKRVRHKPPGGIGLTKKQPRTIHTKHWKKDKSQHKPHEENMFPPIENISESVSTIGRVLDITGPPVNYRSKDVATPYIGYMSKAGSISTDQQKQTSVFRNSVECNDEVKPSNSSNVNIIPRLALSTDKRHEKGNDRDKLARKLQASKQSHVPDINNNSSPKLRMTNANLRTISNNRANRTTSRDLPPKPPPIKSSDGTFSIRKKIEQFRQWHEEQYKDKIKKLKQQVDDQYEAENKKISKSYSKSCENLASLPTVEDLILTRESSSGTNDGVENNKGVSGSGEKLGSDSDGRVLSPRTWKTWRDINDSYAYKDVKKYIEDNDLMTSEKVTWIKQWIVDVDKAIDGSALRGYPDCTENMAEEITL